VLGFGEDDTKGRPASTFLKVGVGRLVTPTATPPKPRESSALLRRPPRPQAARPVIYNFMGAYKFAESPAWQISQSRARRADGVTMGYAATQGRFGWRVQRYVHACGRAVAGLQPLCVDVKLTNTGAQPIRTPYYTSNLYNVKGMPAIGKGFAVSFNIKGATKVLDHAKLTKRSWATPLVTLAKLTLRDTGNSRIGVRRELNLTEKASANFVLKEDAQWNGTFTAWIPALQSWSLLVTHSMHALDGATRARVTPYAFNLYMSRHVFAPRPFWLIELPAGETAHWQHRMAFQWRDRKHRPLTR
jgi:hypothetical protein